MTRLTLLSNLHYRKKVCRVDKQLLYGLMHVYDPGTDTTSVSWAYKDDPELEYFVLEVYDDIQRKWVPYDNLMGIIEKDDTL